MIGATCYEFEIGRVYIRILRPSLYFIPYRHFLTRRFVFPKAFSVRILEK